MIGSDEMAEIPLELESAGTLKMFALYPELQEVLEKGSVFFIDELNARLHPLLVRNFLLTFLNEYSRAVTPQIRQAGNRLSGLAETAYASLLA